MVPSQIHFCCITTGTPKHSFNCLFHSSVFVERHDLDSSCPTSSLHPGLKSFFCLEQTWTQKPAPLQDAFPQNSLQPKHAWAMQLSPKVTSGRFWKGCYSHMPQQIVSPMFALSSEPLPYLVFPGESFHSLQHLSTHWPCWLLILAPPHPSELAMSLSLWLCASASTPSCRGQVYQELREANALLVAAGTSTLRAGLWPFAIWTHSLEFHPFLPAADGLFKTDMLFS